MAEEISCVACGADLTDPRNKGDKNANGDWVCDSWKCETFADAGIETGAQS